MHDTCHKRMLPWRTKTACPAMSTLLSSLTSILSSPPRDEHWRAKKRKWYVRKVRLNFPKHWYKRDRETFQVKHNMDGWSSLTQPLKINSKSDDSRHQFCNHLGWIKLHNKLTPLIRKYTLVRPNKRQALLFFVLFGTGILKTRANVTNSKIQTAHFKQPYMELWNSPYKSFFFSLCDQ